jgi:hypothetical protein
MLVRSTVFSGVHVDRDERFRRLDDEISARRKIAAALEDVPDLRLDVGGVEQRDVRVVELHTGDEVRRDILKVANDFVVDLPGVDREAVDLVAEEVADEAASQTGLAMDERRSFLEVRLSFDFLPLRHEAVQLALEHFGRHVFAHGADNYAARFIGQDGLNLFLQS